MANVRQQITSREAAAALGIPLRTFLRRVADGDIKPAQQLPGVRGAYLFWADEIVCRPPWQADEIEVPS